MSASPANPARSDRRAVLGQCAVGGLLVVVAGALLGWQPVLPAWSDPGPARIGAAIAITVAYLGACAAGHVWRRHRHARRAGAQGTLHAQPVDGMPPRSILVAWASQTGFAEQLAVRTAQALRASGIDVDLRALAELDAALLAAHTRALFIASTTGEGDAPDAAAGFVRDMLDARLDLSGLGYGVLALGDSEYVNFCAFGHRLGHWLQQAGARAMFDVVEVDNGDEGALRHWQHHLGQLAGRADMPDWEPPDYARWRLVDRRLVNPGSAGGPCFHLVLQPLDGGLPIWRAGDIAEVGPRHAPAAVEHWLGLLGLDGASLVDIDGRREALREIAARSVLPVPDEVTGFPPRLLAARMKPLPHREYSIASLPGDRAIELLVRQMRDSNGRLGLGSGWLTEHAPVGGEIAVRVRSNASFHAPQDGRPLILIGNGTGIAGLRALLRERTAAGHRRNWLLFGERNAAHDGFWRDEFERARAAGDIERVDFVWSRDQAERLYVQHRLAERAGSVRAWADDGASIHVCGSLEGMAPGVDRVLRDVLGDHVVNELLVGGRYRRDIY